ncbi:MAG: NADPH-dependent glutamate synthase [Candidatus Firestonebacteria bacterium]
MAEKIPRQKMLEQKVEDRIKNFQEVPYGFSSETAKLEAKRCLQCKKPLCIEGCPVEINIPAFIKYISEGDYIGAAIEIKKANNLPAVCGRVCPQEDQCEKMCILGKKSEPVNIGALERFAADYEREQGEIAIPLIPETTGKKIAVVGSGPAGLTVAGELAKLGHRVTIFEALHETGGVLIYGIPEFRLPKEIVKAEVNYLKKLGAEIILDSVISKIYTVDELLKNGYDAVFLGIGAGLPMFLNIPGENLNGIYSANEYLTRMNLMKAYNLKYDTPIIKSKKVAVIGGGNVAMDSARAALRLGAEVHIIYRRSKDEMPARKDEAHHAQEEGIIFDFLTNPTQFIGNSEGWVTKIECIKMELGLPDSSGRRRPVPVKGSEFTVDVDTVIVALGTRANPLVKITTPDLETTKEGYIVADSKTGKTSKEGVFAGGDIVTGSATVILAMGAGKKAARAIDEYLKAKNDLKGHPERSEGPQNEKLF